jgi:hypothetical protein
MALIDGLDPALGSQVVISGNAELDDDTLVQEEGKPSSEDKPAAEAAEVAKPAAKDTTP